MKKIIMGLVLTTSISTFAGINDVKKSPIECSELGPQAELSISINPKALAGKLHLGEGTAKAIKIKKLEADGAVAIYSFKHDNMIHILTINYDLVSQSVSDAEGDNRNYAVVTYGKAGYENSYAMGCELN